LIDGSSGVVVSLGPATGPASDLGVVSVTELATDPVLPVLCHRAHDVWVLREHVCPFGFAAPVGATLLHGGSRTEAA
jgi:hypothetical protein